MLIYSLNIAETQFIFVEIILKYIHIKSSKIFWLSCPKEGSKYFLSCLCKFNGRKKQSRKKFFSFHFRGKKDYFSLLNFSYSPVKVIFSFSMQSHFGFKIRVSIGFFYIFLPLYRNGFAVRCTIHCRWDFQISSHNLFYQSYKNKDLSSFQTLTLIKKKKKRENVHCHGKQVRSVRKEWTRNTRSLSDAV